MGCAPSTYSAAAETTAAPTIQSSYPPAVSQPAPSSTDEQVHPADSHGDKASSGTSASAQDNVVAQPQTRSAAEEHVIASEAASAVPSSASQKVGDEGDTASKCAVPATDIEVSGLDGKGGEAPTVDVGHVVANEAASAVPSSDSQQMGDEGHATSECAVPAADIEASGHDGKGGEAPTGEEEVQQVGRRGDATANDATSAAKVMGIDADEHRVVSPRAGTPNTPGSAGGGRQGKVGEELGLDEAKDRERSRTRAAPAVGAGGGEASVLDACVFVGTLQTNFEQIMASASGRFDLGKSCTASMLVNTGWLVDLGVQLARLDGEKLMFGLGKLETDFQADEDLVEAGEVDSEDEGVGGGGDGEWEGEGKLIAYGPYSTEEEAMSAVYGVQMVLFPAMTVPSQLAADLWIGGSQVSLALFAPALEGSQPPQPDCAQKWAAGLAAKRSFLVSRRGIDDEEARQEAALPVVVMAPGRSDDVDQAKQKLAALDVFLQDLGSLCAGVCLTQWGLTSDTVAMIERKLTEQQIRVLAMTSLEAVDEASVRALAEAIKRDAKLRCLVLPARVMGPGLVEPLAELLSSSDAPIRHLLLGPLFDPVAPQVEGDLGPMGDAAGAALVRSLTHNTTLAVLDLSECGLGDETARALGELLKSNTTLQEVILVKNKIGDEGIQALMDGVAHNETLKVLDIMDNEQSIIPIEVVERGTEPPERANNCNPDLSPLFVFQDRKLQAELDGGNDVEQAFAARRAAGVRDVDTRLLIKPNVDRRGVAVVEFMREVGDEKDARPMRRIKWFLVGRGEAGKTSLFRALQNPSAATLTDKLDRTVLIDVHEWEPEGENDLHVNVWDCGGQDEYWRVGNQTFLTARRTLYIVILDLSYTPPVVVDGSELANVEWGEEEELRCVKSYVTTLMTHVPSCTVALVGTKMDKVPGGEEEARARLEKAHGELKAAIAEHLAGLQALHDELSARLEDLVTRNVDLLSSEGQDKKLKGVQNWLEDQLRYVTQRLRSPPVIVGEPEAVSANDGRTMSQLRKAVLSISQDAEVFPDMRSVVPGSWMNLLELVQRQQAAYPLMQWTQFREVMLPRSGFDSPQRFNRAVAFLHAVGVLLHYSEIEGLSDVVVIRPTWLVEAFRQVIRHDFRHIERLGGRMAKFARDLRLEGELSLLLDWGRRVEPPVPSELLVALMRQFDLAIPRTPTTYFVPSLAAISPLQPCHAELWPETLRPAEGALGLALTLTPPPNGAFERLVARCSSIFDVLPGTWRATSRGGMSGAFLRPRVGVAREATTLLLRIDGGGRCVLLARHPQSDTAIATACGAVLCALELLTQLLKEAFAGVVATVRGILCPQCLGSASDGLRHVERLEAFLGPAAVVGAFDVDVVKRMFKGVRYPHESEASCRTCETPASQLKAQLHGLRMSGRSEALDMLRDAKVAAGRESAAGSRAGSRDGSRRNLRKIGSMIKSVPVAASFKRVPTLRQALSIRKDRAALTEMLSNQNSLGSMIGTVPVSSDIDSAPKTEEEPPSDIVARKQSLEVVVEGGGSEVEEAPGEGAHDDERLTAEALREVHRQLLAEWHEAMAVGEEERPPFIRQLPAGINGELQEAPYGSFLHPILEEAGHPSGEEKQAVLESVKQLLAVSWSPPPVIGTGFHIDFAVRDAQIRSIGAPKMVVLSWRLLEQLGRIPRSSEGLAVSIPEAMAAVAEQHRDCGPPALLQYEDNPFGGASVPPECWPHLDSELGTNPRLNLVMVSHRWLRPSMDPALAHPDDEAGTKARLLAHYGRQEAEAPGRRETYFWIDYCSVDQDNVMPGIEALPLYISNCVGGMLVVANPEYEDRAWCRLEQVLYAAFSAKPVFTVTPSPASVKGAQRWLSDWKKKLLNPATGNLTSDADRQAVSLLTDIAVRHYSQSWVYPTSEMRYVLRGVAVTDGLQFGATEVVLEAGMDDVKLAAEIMPDAATWSQ